MNNVKKYLIVTGSGLAVLGTVFAASKSVVLKPEFNSAMTKLVGYIDARFDRLEKRLEKRYDSLDQKLDRVIERQLNEGN